MGICGINCAEAVSVRVMFGLGFAVCCMANITAGLYSSCG